MNLSRRSDVAETMHALPEAEYAAALRDLAAVNRVTFTHAPILRFLGEVSARQPAGTTLHVLDVACGHGDLLRHVARWAARRRIAVALEGVDLDSRGIAEARRATPAGMPITYRVGDVFDETATVDVITSSQFTHHLTDDEIVAFLLWMQSHARLGWIVADLQRRFVPYLGFRVLARLAGWHRVVRTDGTISIARSFRPADWHALLERAGMSAAVRPEFPWRLTVSRIA